MQASQVINGKPIEESLLADSEKYFTDVELK